MKIVSLFRIFAIGIAVQCAAAPTYAAPGDYPNRPIKLVVGYVPGGSPDMVARALSQRLGQILGQPVIVENKPGAGGSLATAQVAKAPADGYTLILGETGQLVIAPQIFKSLSYDVMRDFVPIGMVGTTPLVLVANAKTGIRTLADLFREARANPGRLSYGSSGLGSIHHIAVEVLKAGADIDMQHVPYRGSGASVPAIVSGEIPVLMTSLTTILPFVKSGTVNLLGVSSATRYPGLPNVPAIAETVKGYDYSSEMGILAPAGTPTAIVSKLSRALQEAVNSPDVRERYQLGSIVPVFTSSADYAENLWNNLRKYEQAVKRARIDLTN